ncbi:hypothetical protein F5888DRAFT_1724706 [Russula emetica]|nr:hypothetical protein F5888DRAFT_1724706 [Russula emetica]
MLKAGQSKLSSFFAKPTTTTTTTTTARHQQMQAHHPTELDGEEMDIQSSSIPLPTNTSEIRFPADKDNTPAYSQSQEKKNENEKTGSAASSWSAPAKEFRVNIPGPNKGKTFYLCARPVRPGYDKGRNERLREEVDHQYKCNFFLWASDAMRAVAAAASSGVAGAASQGEDCRGTLEDAKT